MDAVFAAGMTVMAAHPTETEADLAPGDETLHVDYHRDFYSWLLEQARHLRAGRWTALDRENLAEEIESLGREQFNKLESVLRILMLHMLKRDHQPDRRGRSWWASISEQRLRLDDVLADNPGLQPRIQEAITRAYRRARLRAIKETDLDEWRFPEACPYSWDDIVSREFSI
jgi:hypothetical protein